MRPIKLIGQPNVLSSILLSLIAVCLIKSISAVQHAELTKSSPVAGPTSAAARDSATSRSAHGGQHGRTKEDSPIYLESMEDLEHVAYLSLRNFNITDEGLIQSGWPVGLGGALTYKQHQKAAQSAGGESQQKKQMALMLEAFISHLRNGHLRRMRLDELQSVASGLNISSSTEDRVGESEQSQVELVSFNSTTKPDVADTTSSNETIGPTDEHQSYAHRCNYLVSIYEHELRERGQQHRVSSDQRHQQSLKQTLQSQVEYEVPQTTHVNVIPNNTVEYYMPTNPNGSQPTAAGKGQTGGQKDNADQETATENQQVVIKDRKRMMQLCRLVVECQSAEELVSIISGPWLSTAISSANSEDGLKRERRVLNSLLEEFRESQTAESSTDQEYEQSDKSRPKNLRDSLSLSIAKLCPLILFQLHEDEGLCVVRRDDRPPMITVWAFATLFVTIVSFCSLIGLSITPLLGSTATEDSSSSSSSSSSPMPGHRLHRTNYDRSHSMHKTDLTGLNNHPHRTCLTLFEGLAVGSLVGSALFSLIPQAFELQERESNQGFLLKALIIFLGIYLFFCSERIMRIILDARQLRKKKKLNHRSFNSIPHPSTTFDFVDHHHHHHQHQQQQQLIMLQNYQPALMASNTRDRQTEATKNNTGTGRRMLSNDSSTGGANRTKSVCRISAKKQRHRSSHQPTGSSGIDQHISKDSTSSANRATTVNFPSQAQQEEEQKLQRKLNQSLKTPGRLAELADGKAVSTGARRSTGSTGGRQVKNRTRRRRTRQQLLASKRQHHKRHHLNRQYQPSTKLRNLESDDEYYEEYSHKSDCSKSIDSNSSSASDSDRSVSKLRRLNRAENFVEWPQDMVDYWTATNKDNVGEYDNDEESGDEGLQMDCNFVGNFDGINAADLSDCKQMQAVSREIGRAASRQTSSDLKTTFHLGHHQDGPYMHNPRYAFTNEPSEQPMAARQDISTVAWMIVLGDGLHNFIDGISIGAAFSESILSGVSISVAVICEEFPHELGDFAVLVSSGMTVRQALGYNFLSACTCYFGMAVGIILGDVNDGASYISALAAGVFLYIALVDMMGELSATLEDASRNSIAKTLKLLLLQNVGIFIGISIIFILSFIDF